jgi:hypothetical protein
LEIIFDKIRDEVEKLVFTKTYFKMEKIAGVWSPSGKEEWRRLAGLLGSDHEGENYYRVQIIVQFKLFVFLHFELRIKEGRKRAQSCTF